MKKALIFGSVLCLTALSMTSCKKEYTCNCKIVQTLDGVEMGSSETTATFKAKKKDAEKECGNGNVTQTINMGGIEMQQTGTCTLK